MTMAVFLPVAKSMIQEARVLVKTDAEAVTSKELGHTLPVHALPVHTVPAAVDGDVLPLHHPAYHEPDTVDTEEDFLNAYSALETA